MVCGNLKTDKKIFLKHLRRIFAIFGIVSGGYCLIENRQLKVTEYDINNNKIPNDFENKKILLLSDLHNKRYGDNFNNLINSVEAAKPDYIFFAGDIYSRNKMDLKPALGLMHRLKEIAPVFYTAGNHEIENQINFNHFCNTLEAMGICVLRNNKTVIYGKNGGFINIFGLELPMKYYKNKDGGYKNLPYLNLEKMEAMIGKCDTNYCNFLISHNPFFLKTYSKWGADIVFSGHCHGGIIRLPFIGGMLSPERKFFPKYTKGVYSLGNSKLVLTAGMGKFRINNPAEIVVCTLKKNGKSV